ncbi:MAG: response regulator transcription factor [Gammaproteobacteria bacterium]|nr:response regulator transcription factor [Gammaproteobacteria bacterium]
MTTAARNIATRIAVIEDDVHQGKLTCLWLEGAGYACQHFESGKFFIKNIRRETFDLLLLDWNLPAISGDEILIWVRRHLDWRMPVLFVTSRSGEDDIVRALELGADDYMVKPIRRGELLARIGALARRSEGTAQKKNFSGLPLAAQRNLSARISARSCRHQWTSSGATATGGIQKI